MSVRVSYNGKKLTDVFSQANLEKANYVVANQAMQDMDQFVPYKQGHLAGSAHIRIRNYTRSEHPQASRRWDLRAKNLYMNRWLNKVNDSLLGGH